MRFLTLILDALVIAFFTVALYRLAIQKSDSEIEKDREKNDRREQGFDKLNESFDEEEGNTLEAPLVH
jgi:uncharacterized membrane protein